MVAVIWMGVYPSVFLDIMEPSVMHLLENHDKAMAAAEVMSDMAANATEAK